MKKISYIAISLVAILMIGGSFGAGFLYSAKIHQKTSIKTNNNFNYSILKEAVTDINTIYYDNASEKKMLNGALKGIMDSLGNPYANYYAPSDYGDFKTSINGNYSGIGVIIGEEKKQIKILKIFDKSPAKKLLKVGDTIISINGKTTKKMKVDAASGLIKGPENTIVKLEIKRANKQSTVSITRAKIDFPNVVTKQMGDIGYITMHIFSGGASEQLKKELSKYNKSGIKKIILDLRSNPGGQLNEAIDVSSLFIDSGVIVRTKNKIKEETVYSATGGRIYTGKLVVLINENSASASEIVAGAIQDRHRGKIVGVKSYGKGTVQQVVQLSNNGALVIPSERWSTPSGRDITKKGISPDFFIKNNDKKVDKQLNKAKELLK